jgi:PAS domain S-box-containing protein
MNDKPSPNRNIMDSTRATRSASVEETHEETVAHGSRGSLSEFPRLLESVPDSFLARQLMELLPAAVYTCNAPSGVITYYNRRAAELWGREPAVGDTDERFCGSFRLFRSDGTPLRHAETPMAQVLNGGAPIRNQEVVIERPDGSRINALVNIDPLTNTSGKITGAINVFSDVTELKQAERASRQLAAIVESSEDVIISKDLNGIIMSWNQAAERLFGYTAEEVIGKPITFLIPPERHDEEPVILERIRRGERIEHYETIRRRKDGGLLDISLTVSPIRDVKGNIVGASKIARDITQRKRMEVALRETEERFHTVAMNSPAAIFIKDLMGRYTLANPLACQALGRPDSVVGLTDYDLIPSDLADLLRSHDREVVSSGLPLEREELVGDRCFLSVKFPLMDSQGQPAGIGGVAVDITERKQVELALRESEERFRTLANNISQFAWMADVHGWIFWYNQRWFDYTGTTLEEMQGWGWQKVHHPDHVERVVEKISHCFKTGEVWEDTFPLRSRDGSYRWFLSRALPIRDTEGRIIRWFGTNTDVTEQRETEEALRENEEKLRHQAQELEQQLIMSGRLVSLGEVTASMAHEFNNPLGIIMGFVEDMLGSTDPADPNYRALQIVEEESKRCRQLVRDLMEYARPKTAEFCPTSISDMVVKTLQLVENRLYKEKVVVEKNLNPELPRIHADSQQLEQVLVNLYLNAIDAMPEGGTLIVEAKIAQSDGAPAMAMITVGDTGFGIAETDLPKIFQPFFTAKKRRGMGLGLPICQRIIRNHGGTIEVESEAGKGTTFKIYLPLDQRIVTESKAAVTD